MKNFLICCFFFVLLASSAYGQGGVEFTKDSWEQTLKRAAEEDKLIFMDAYAEWCGPCKMMSREVFPDGQVGAFFNEHFINVKMDMEKGEGPGLAMSYQVQAYPTLLFIDSDGNLVHRAVGYHGADDFLQLGADAMDPDKSLGSLERRYMKGERDPDFLRKYANAAFDAMDDKAEDIGRVYLETQDDWSTEENMLMILRSTSDVHSHQFEYFAENLPAFSAAFDEQYVVDKYKGLVFREAIGLPESEVFTSTQALLAKAFPEEAGQMTAEFKMIYYDQAGKVEQYAAATVDYLDRYPSDDWMLLNQVAWSFFQTVDDKAQLKKAVKWAERSVELDTNYYNTDTLAALLYRLGQTKKARKWAEKAIELGKAAGEDYSSTEQLLQQINQ
ncbi:MAG: DUF255 domain-containing protein [Saprospiraceae bacterium]|nr:DUF255 domain-containing protein [Saprospiraceae bacterium]